MRKLLQEVRQAISEEIPVKTIVLQVTDQDNSIESLLKYIQHTANIGHSFSVVVDPETKEFTKSFGIDGDGADHIKSIDVK